MPFTGHNSQVMRKKRLKRQPGITLSLWPRANPEVERTVSHGGSNMIWEPLHNSQSNTRELHAKGRHRVGNNKRAHGRANAKAHYPRGRGIRG